jgi:hypothetical protein
VYESMRTFAEQVTDAAGTTYRAVVQGAAREDGMWEGWLVFEPLAGGDPLRTGRETTQPNRDSLEYWASGLEPTYLDGALSRALRERVRGAGGPAVPAAAASDAAAASPEAAAPPTPRALLDPFQVARQGEDVLRDELQALDAGHQRNIIRAHGLADERAVDLDVLDRRELTGLILRGVRRRTGAA